MPITAPPRPPRPEDPVTHGEFDALVEALIEEARQRGLRRRRRNAAIVTLVALVGVGLLAFLGRSAQSQTASQASSVRSSVPAGAARSQIAFMRDTPGLGEGHKMLYVMNADGSGLRLLAGDAWMEIAWSPDGREIAFFRVGSSPRPGLYVVRADGRGERPLTRNAMGSGLAWAPDGESIAFTRGGGPFYGGPEDYRDIWVVNADGSGQRRLVKRAIEPRWSPGGQQISFMSLRAGNWEIYVMNADGSDVRRLTHNTASDGYPAWSPDGRKLAFTRFRPAHSSPSGSVPGYSDVYVMNADGTGQRRLAHNATFNGWSPQGSRIAFSSTNGGLYVVDADGSGPQNLTRTGWASTWSPDGRKIAFAGSHGIYVMNADGSDMRKLMRNAGWMVWSHAQK
jgi:dipeptidyl aminopeptidase/acylaminoacyl peptidase